MKKRRFGLMVVGVLAGVLLVPSLAMAFSARSGDIVTLPKGERHEGSYYAAGKNLTFDGDIDGDLICAGSNVSITGTVRGDVICAGQTVSVAGHVEGDVRLAGQTVTLSGQVDRNASVAAQTFTLSGGTVGRDLAVVGQSTAVNAPVGRDLYGSMDSLAINAPVGGRVDAWLTSLSLGSAGRVAGDLNYTSEKTVSLDKSHVGGAVAHHQPPVRKTERQSSRIDVVSWMLSRLYWMVAGLIVALLLAALLPRPLNYMSGLMVRRAWVSFGVGALVLFFGPLALILLALTLFGLPLAALLGGLWLLAVSLTSVVASITVGHWLLERGVDGYHKSLVLSALVGVPVVVILTGIPYLGGLLSLVMMCWALGAMVISLRAGRMPERG